MPHFHLETTADLAENDAIPAVLERLVETLVAFETIPAGGVRAYHTLRPVWAVAPGHPEGFVHLELALMAGRPPELLARIADAVWTELRAAFAVSLEGGAGKATFELREMNSATYRK